MASTRLLVECLRNISNIFEEASPLRDKLMFIVIGARDFSPEITEHLIGTKVPCFDRMHLRICYPAAPCPTKR